MNLSLGICWRGGRARVCGVSSCVVAACPPPTSPFVACYEERRDVERAVSRNKMCEYFIKLQWKDLEVIRMSMEFAQIITVWKSVKHVELWE